MGADFTGHTWTHLDTASRAESDRAARYVTGMAARDKADATHLLAVLGLLPAGHPATLRPSDHGMRGYKVGCRCERCVKWNRNRLDRQKKAARKGANA
jgi:hypothetical protein